MDLTATNASGLVPGNALVVSDDAHFWIVGNSEAGNTWRVIDVKSPLHQITELQEPFEESGPIPASFASACQCLGCGRNRPLRIFPA